MDRRCDHRGSACLHRPIPPQAYRMDEPLRFSWREVGEILLGTLVLGVALCAIYFYFVVAAVSQS